MRRNIGVWAGIRLAPSITYGVGQHSIRINGQYRLCFRWFDGNALEVEIADYH